VTDWVTQSTRLHGRAPVWDVDDADAASKALTAPAPIPSPSPIAPPPSAPKRKLSYKEQRELEGLPQRIEALEAEQKSIDEALAGGALYGSDPARAAALAERHEAIEFALMEALERWETLGHAP
jgi:ABC transport system ATP-binding/permease protein